MIILETSIVSELIRPNPSSNVVAWVAGRPINHADYQIAAIARSREASVATKDVDDFEGVGVDVINPWAIG